MFIKFGAWKSLNMHASFKFLFFSRKITNQHLIAVFKQLQNNVYEFKTRTLKIIKKFKGYFEPKTR